MAVKGLASISWSLKVEVSGFGMWVLPEASMSVQSTQLSCACAPHSVLPAPCSVLHTQCSMLVLCAPHSVLHACPVHCTSQRPGVKIVNTKISTQPLCIHCRLSDSKIQLFLKLQWGYVLISPSEVKNIQSKMHCGEMAQQLRMHIALAKDQAFSSQHPLQAACNYLYLWLHGDPAPLASNGICTYVHILLR